MRKYSSILAIIFAVTAMKAQPPIVNPNPFAKRSLISYTMTVADTVALSVYDLTGKEILVIRSKAFIQAGTYQDSLIMDNFPDGLYIVALYSETKSYGRTKAIKSAEAGLPEINAQGRLSFFPNPVRDEMVLKSGNKDLLIQELSIYNTLGQLIYTGSQFKSGESIYLGDLLPGIYYLHLRSDDIQGVLKMVKE